MSIGKSVKRFQFKAMGWIIALGLSAVWGVILTAIIIAYEGFQSGFGGESIINIILGVIGAGAIFGAGSFLLVQSPIWRILLVLSDTVPFGAVIFLPVPLIFYFIFSWPAIQIGKIVGWLVDESEIPTTSLKPDRISAKSSAGNCPFSGMVLIDKETTVLGFAWPSKTEIFRIGADWRVQSKGKHFGWVDVDGGIHRDPMEGKIIDPSQVLTSSPVAYLKNSLLIVDGLHVGELQR